MIDSLLGRRGACLPLRSNSVRYWHACAGRESKEVGSNVGAAVRLGVQRGSRAEVALAALTPSELADAFAVSVADVEVVADSRSGLDGVDRLV